MTARPLDECTLAPARPVAKRQAKSAQKLCACGRKQERAAARADPDDEHHPLAETVRRHPPRHERQDRAEERRGDEDARLREREVVLVAQRGASTATPNQIAEYVDWANVPAARTAQR